MEFNLMNNELEQAKKDLIDLLSTESTSLGNIQISLDNLRNLVLQELNKGEKVPPNHELIIEALGLEKEEDWETSSHTHYGDLCILYTEDRYNWLIENYQFPSNIKLEFANVEGHPWHGKRFIEIPFCVIKNNEQSSS